MSKFKGQRILVKYCGKFTDQSRLYREITCVSNSVADPIFAKEGNSIRFGGANLLFSIVFAENVIKIKQTRL